MTRERYQMGSVRRDGGANLAGIMDLCLELEF